MGYRDSLQQAAASPCSLDDLHGNSVAQSHQACGVPGLGPLNIALLVSEKSLQIMKTLPVRAHTLALIS